ncbi:hypothetical protein BX600DRAFT_518451 [Xylariales sp. PMI_506]|nr:hypothetical protein BX600DRAFT_518451 [Xylariales sp. PMI_506]
MGRTLFTRTLVLTVAALLSPGAIAQSGCPAGSLNSTVGSWTPSANDTIFSIAAAVGRGVCDIARANRMADAELLRPGFSLIIPAQTCYPDQDSCLLVAQNATMDCIYGGPHVYTAVEGDTLSTIALKKLNITVASLLSTGLPPHGGSSSNGSADAPLAPGTGVKVPQCSPSRCVVEPYRFTYGTYKDLAASFGTTVGQIFAFNPTYGQSDADEADSPVITVPLNCLPLASNVTAIS